MPSKLIILSTALVFIASAYRLWIQPTLIIFGQGRVIESLGTTGCTTVPALSACEKIVLHAPTGVLYLACSSPASRAHWTPALVQLNASGPDVDYLATYDPLTSTVARLQPSFPGLSVHGMDVVPSTSNSSELFIYAVNHRKPEDRHTASMTGADSTIEIFKTTVGSTTLKHLRTLQDPVILTPNDIVGSPDGDSFFFTNDHSSKTSPMRYLSVLGLESGSVGYCHVQSGCKFAIKNIHGANGIVRAPNNESFYVSNSVFGGIAVLERQTDNALLKTHTIPTGAFFGARIAASSSYVLLDRGIDNLSMDMDGVLWGPGFPYFTSIIKHIADPSVVSPVSAHSIARNTGPGSFYGEKFKVTKVFEDDGTLASGTTSVVHDPVRKRLFLHGIASPHLTICPI
ncbi:hypothetical protein C8F04DRAFT_1025033 [Mycena alexandri]|uniref:Calcium-dependent phosphotriesterase n=1 Tax=Mycena alexandri TaxID=1745969 RepID=A0AAD6TG41_9AGAR|nr:hypothetical protein C8F04DRAFT_1025033 [Mycena alexandri]